MKFSNLLWSQVAPLYEKIVEHPFNIELARGTLDRQKFDFYLRQDVHYLVAFSRALALIASRTEASQQVSQFLNFALSALVAERDVHATFLDPQYVGNCVEPSPACLAYTNYLIATAATASLEEAIAAILPCFWIYKEVGQEISQKTEQNNPYILWIRTYSTQEFIEGTEKAIAILDEIADRATLHTLEKMKKAFEYSCHFEWHFWNDAYGQKLFRSSHQNKIYRLRANKEKKPLFTSLEEKVHV